MRAIKGLPRILKINDIQGMNISVVFNNGETRIIHFSEVFDSLHLTPASPAFKLKKAAELKKVSLQNHTLSWENASQIISLRGERKKVPFEIGADTLYQHSHPVEAAGSLQVGKMLKQARQRAGVSQQVLADKSGTSRNYISRIENAQSGIELSTLQKIVETGLGAQLNINIAFQPGAVTKGTQRPMAGRVTKKHRVAGNRKTRTTSSRIKAGSGK